MRRIPFIVWFYGIYTLMHAYLLWRVLAATWPGPRLAGAAAGICLVPILLPRLVRMLRQRRRFDAAAAVALPCYSWMAWLFLFFMLALAVDLVSGAAWALSAAGVDIGVPGLGLRAAAPVGGATLACAWGACEAAWIRLTTIELSAPVSAPLRLVQISDLHLGSVGQRRLAQVIRLVQAAEPDIVVSTGDLLDTSSPGLQACAVQLAEIAPRYGKYAVTGNHEYSAGSAVFSAVHEQAGFQLLANRSVVNAAPGLHLAGVEDPYAEPLPDGADAESLALGELPADGMCVLLKHRPVISEQARTAVDLQLSGHTHGGQIAPFGVFCWLLYRLGHGLKASGARCRVYISRGAGTWGPPIRVGAPPEVTLFVIRPDDATRSSA
jgi:predicted MPP superfamily phosphohydrolase